MILTMAEATELVVGRPQGDHLAIRVRARMHPDSDDYWDGNWLISPITAHLGGFTAHLGAGLRVDELQRFRHGLERMNLELRGEATLHSIEYWIALTVTCRPNGALAVAGQLDDGHGNNLRFDVADLDQTDLPEMISALSSIEHAYPLLGQQ